MIGGKSVDLVLGLSMTSADVRWVLVEGTTAEGATICRDAVDFDTLDDVLDAVGENRLHAIGVTWAIEAEAAASTLLDALAARGLDDVITVSEEEAADALATGIADRGGYSDVTVCIVDPDDALVALVDADGVRTERVEPTTDDMLAVLDRSDARPEAIFVLGSADDIDEIASSIDGAGTPVITSAEADLALARGAALASAQAVNLLDTPQGRWRVPSRIGALTSVLAAAVVVFVISLSVALGLGGLAPDTDPTVAQQDTTVSTDQPARVPTAPTVAQAGPRPVPVAPPPAPPPPEAVVAQTIVEAAAPAPAPPAAPPPVYDTPPAYVPPAPPPNYVPPAPPPQPRLRDRIIERIPIINRFHEPSPYG